MTNTNHDRKSRITNFFKSRIKEKLYVFIRQKGPTRNSWIKKLELPITYDLWMRKIKEILKHWEVR